MECVISQIYERITLISRPPYQRRDHCRFCARNAKDGLRVRKGLASPTVAAYLVVELPPTPRCSICKIFSTPPIFDLTSFLFTHLAMLPHQHVSFAKTSTTIVCGLHFQQLALDTRKVSRRFSPPSHHIQTHRPGHSVAKRELFESAV